jgi:hypothetical protein
MQEYTYFIRVARFKDSLIHYVLCEDIHGEPHYFFVQLPDHLVTKLEETSKGTRVELERLGEIVASGEGYLPTSSVKDYLFTSYGLRVESDFGDEFETKEF